MYPITDLGAAARALDGNPQVIGWRDVPFDNSMIGDTAKGTEPHIVQCFVENTTGRSNWDFERELYRVRKVTLRVIQSTAARTCMNTTAVFPVRTVLCCAEYYGSFPFTLCAVLYYYSVLLKRRINSTELFFCTLFAMCQVVHDQNRGRQLTFISCSCLLKFSVQHPLLVFLTALSIYPTAVALYLVYHHLYVLSPAALCSFFFVFVFRFFVFCFRFFVFVPLTSIILSFLFFFWLF